MMAAKTISFFRGQLPVRAKGQVHCTFHSDKIFQLYCITCQELACIKCVSTIHKGHNFDDLQDLTPQKKEKILNFIVTSESIKSNEFQQSLASADKKLTENASNFEKLSIAVKAQAERLKREIDDVTLKEISIFKEIKEDNEKLLHQYKEDINNRKEQFGIFLKECKDTVQSESDIQVHDTEKEVDTHMNYTRPSVPAVQVVSFTPNLSPLHFIKQAFGLVTVDRKASTSQPWNVIPSNTETGKTVTTDQPKCRTKTQKSATRKEEKTLVRPRFPKDQYRQMHSQTTKILAHFQSPCGIGDMSVIGEEAWTCCSCYESITLINKIGEQKREIKLTGFALSISVSPTTRHCWAHSGDGKIIEVTPTEVIHRFNTIIHQMDTICVTLDQHILIGGSGLTKMTPNGKTVLKTPASWSGEHLCVSPRKMSECRLTRNVAMVDGDNVLVIDKNFQKLFEYKGAVSTNEQAIAKKESQAWRTQDVAYDNTGNLVVCDKDTIRLLSNEGMFLRQLFFEQNGRINCVCTDETGNLWITSDNFDVKLLQYT